MRSQVNPQKAQGWLYLYFPSFYRHSLLSLANEPLAILHGQGHHIIDHNISAEKAGITLDMPLASALYSCPNLITHTLDSSRLQHLLQQRALWAYQFSAQVSPDTQYAEQGHAGLWLEAGSMLRLFGGLEAFWRHIDDACRQQEWPVQLAAGLTPLAARLLARANKGFPSLEHATINSALQALPLLQLDFNAADTLALQRLGINTLGELLRLPLAELGRRINPNLVHTLQQLSGSKKHTLMQFKPPLNFHDNALFMYEVEHRNGLLFPLSRLLESLSGFLHHRQLSTRWLKLRLQHAEPPDTYWQFELVRPEYRHSELLNVCRYQLERKQLRAPVRELHLSVTRFLDRKAEQGGCLQDADTQATVYQVRDDAALLNRLQARLDEEQVQCLKATADPRPEKAWQTYSLQQAQHKTTHSIQARHAKRPLWLLPKPHPCPPPEHILHGPERIASGWWDDHAIRRDYYQVLCRQQLIWVFRDDHGQWFVHGYFG